MKLLRLEIDNRWGQTESNEFTLTVGEDRKNCSVMRLQANDELCARVLEALLPEATSQLSAMFEQLTGSDTPDTEDDTPEQVPFIPTEIDPEPLGEAKKDD